ncbi:acyl-CoA dehydrogenase family protein [Sphingomonas sp. HITSZ_GF]|uniref:acyl-CoA dehydrogenase family protein n=1 Tax=Sphingomonas sp. HITSZ_GF TaxID=3037247 RepID=UPI00240E1E9D|nr:acyl-CoA dehydrogenase family protein [Sphingomonas sp. HITSZ_GF]MDG2533857.1 acyl-CoA dehydrogenase family protein [Sphingomonas sp. HITSZ_GF]
MSDTGDLLMDMTARLLGERFDDAAMRAARAGAWPQPAWDAVTEQGLPLALVEGEQGFGVPLAEGLSLVGLIGRHAAPLPLAETMIGNALLARAGLPVGRGVLALVPEGVTLASGRATGEAERIAWARNADALLIEDGGQIALVTDGFRIVAEGSNLAHMPRDRIAVDAPAQVAPLPGIGLREAGALVRALAMAGALQTLTGLTITHVTERVQFGRALSAFQAVQHSLARLASEAAAAAAAADLAADSFADNSPYAGIAIAAARTRISEAAGTAIGIAHQLHGAIGFTEEHRLHWFTTALWAWRDEFGSASWWTRRLGQAALTHSKAAYWPFITSV